MKALSIMLIYTLLLARVFAQTIVSGNQSGTWTTSGSPYIVTGNVTVVDSLIIQPGVEVKFDAGGWQITVGNAARLLARGIKENPIVFEPFQQQNPGSWGKLYFHNTGNDDTLEYCIIRYATIGIQIQTNTTTVLDNCIIYGYSQYGVFIYSCCENYTEQTTGILSNCTIYNFADNGQGVYVRSASPQVVTKTATAELYKCTIYGNTGNGIYVVSAWPNTITSRANVINCTISNNLQNGIRVQEDFGVADATVINTIIAFNGEYGITNESGANVGTADILYNCFWDNASGNFYSISGPGFGQNGPYQNANGDSCDINFNIYNDPFFVDTSNANFHLQGSSKCIDAGSSIISGQFVLDPDSTLPDMGAYYFPQLVSIENGITELPGEYLLQQNYPNPFNPSTTIRFTLPKATQVRLTVFNALGEQVAEALNEHKPAGAHTVTFDGRNLSSGVYYYRIEAEDFRQVRKMLLVR